MTASEGPAVAAGAPVWALGLMSGTSLDGIDAGLVLTDGERIYDTGPSRMHWYAEFELPALREVLADPPAFREPDGPRAVETLARAAGEVERAHAAAAAALLAEVPAAQQPRLIGFPGQTLAHAPERGWTWQIGDGAAVARALARPVVWDLRSADVAAGGQGAPLAPFFHRAALAWKG
ncbi:MAG: anhydro-N-acetylmuramic acid kinase, partial [Pseudomonadota bacterium]